MITLDIAAYCHNCPEFKVRRERCRIESGPDIIYNHILTCEHKNMCGIIKEHLLKEDDSNDQN